MFRRWMRLLVDSLQRLIKIQRNNHGDFASGSVLSGKIFVEQNADRALRTEMGRRKTTMEGRVRRNAENLGSNY